MRYFDVRILWYIRFQVFYRWLFGSVGRHCYLGRPLFWKGIKRVHMGNRVRIFPLSRIELLGEKSQLTLGNDISIGHNLHLICSGSLLIGDGTTVSSNVFINDTDFDYTMLNVSNREQPLVTKQTTIGSFCFIGIGAVIQAGTILGSNVIVGANSVVKGTFPDNCIVAGVPAKIIFIYCQVKNTWIKYEQ